MEHKSNPSVILPHHLSLHERNSLDLEGVTEVGHFDELSVVVYTSLGELTVCGQNLHVRRLSLEDGLLSLEGRIDSLTYHELKKRGGFFSRMLR